MLVETFPVCNKKSGCSNNFGRLEYMQIHMEFVIVCIDFGNPYGFNMDHGLDLD